MDVLADLETLAAFVGTRVPLSSPNPQLLPLLTHPSHTTFPWAPLRIALESFFGTPDAIDPARVQGGWAGLRCYIAAFKRLEAVDSEAETAEVMTWLLALKDAAIQTSLFCKAPETDMLYDVLAGLHTPVTAEDLPTLVARAGSNAGSLPAWQTIASGSTSFERGGDGPLSPSPPLKAALPAVFPRPSLEEVVSRASSVDKNLPTAKRPQAPAPTVITHLSQQGVKRKRSASIEQVSLGLRPRDSTVSTSALSSFADFSDRAERDGDEDELEEDDDDDEDVDELNGSIASSTSSRNFLPTRSPARSSTTAKSAASVSNSNNGNTHGAHSTKIDLLAQRLSSVTGIPFAKCLETVARVPKEELNNVDASAPIPASLFPSALGVTTVAPPAVAPPAPSHKSTKRSNPTEDREDGRKVVRSHDPNRPAFSYSALIGQAILSTSDKRMRLAEIYEYVTANYPYYTKNECGWQNSIRHNLSLQPVFAKMTDQGAPGKKGCHWMILESEEWRFADGGWRKIDTKGEPKVKKEKEKKVRKSQSKKNLKSDASSGGGFEDNGPSSEFTLDRAAAKAVKMDDDDFSE